jgi:hypothetical protein
VETAVLTPTKFYERRAKDCVQAAGRTDNHIASSFSS